MPFYHVPQAKERTKCSCIAGVMLDVLATHLQPFKYAVLLHNQQAYAFDPFILVVNV